jgi:hypothetical protein
MSFLLRQAVDLQRILEQQSPGDEEFQGQRVNNELGNMTGLAR